MLHQDGTKKRMSKMNIFLKTMAMVALVGGVCAPLDAQTAENKCKAKSLKAEKRIMEDGNGYVIAMKSDTETAECVATINAKRKAKYESIAKKDGVLVEEVAKIAAQKIQD